MSKELDPVCTNDECRKKFWNSGLSYSDISDSEILILVMMLNEEIKKANKNEETSVDTLRLSEKITIKHKSNGTITECYLYLNSHYFTRRECISFNKNGFIGFAGWADDGNLNPIKRAFIRWVDYLIKLKKEG